MAKFHWLVFCPAIFSAQAASIAPNIASPDPAPSYAVSAGFAHETLQENFLDSGADMLKNAVYNPTGFWWYNGVKQCCQIYTDTTYAAVTYPAPYDATTGKAFFPFSWSSIGIAAHDDLLTTSSGAKVWANGVATSVASNAQGWTQTYGYFEVKAEVGGTKGAWSAPLWLVSQACFVGLTGCGEIDIIEQYYRYPMAYSATMHDYQHNTSSEVDPVSTVALSAGFHRYGILWTASMLTFYLDGVAVGSVATPSVMIGQPYYLLFDQGIGGACPPCQATAGAPNAVTSIGSIHVWGP